MVGATPHDVYRARTKCGLRPNNHLAPADDQGHEQLAGHRGAACVDAGATRAGAQDATMQPGAGRGGGLDLLDAARSPATGHGSLGEEQSFAAHDRWARPSHSSDFA